MSQYLQNFNPPPKRKPTTFLCGPRQLILKKQSEVSKREKWLVPVFTNFLNITNLDLIIFTQNTFIGVKTGYVKKLLLTPPPHDPPAPSPGKQIRFVASLTSRLAGRQESRQSARQTDRHMYIMTKYRKITTERQMYKHTCTFLYRHT
jgi:hypothetical protein